MSHRLRIVCCICALSALVALAGCGGVSPAPISGLDSAQGVSISVAPLTVTVDTGTSQTFTATVSNSSLTKVGWMVNGVPGGNTAIGTITSKGVYTAPPYVPNPGAVTITAVSQADSSKMANATATITGSLIPPSGPHIVMSPVQASVPLGTTYLFTATVTGTSETAVNFLVNGEPSGSPTIYGEIQPEPGSSDGAVYIAPLIMPGSGSTTVDITAELASDNSVTASAVVTLTTESGSGGVSISPTSATVPSGQTQLFTATVSGISNPAVEWQVDGVKGGNSALGKIVAGPNNTATYTAPGGVTSSFVVTVTAASIAEPGEQGSAQVTVALPQQIVVVVLPPSANLVVGQNQEDQQQFEASVRGASNETVTWQVNQVTGGNSTYGTITTDGLYTTPATVPNPPTVTVDAVSNEDPSVRGTASVNLSSAPVVSVTISPSAPQNVQVGTNDNFVATVNNSSDPTVTWEVNNEPGGDSTIGTIVSTFPEYDATYTAPNTIPSNNPVTVTAVSNADPTKSASVTVTITQSISVTVDPPPPVPVMTGQSQQFTAFVTGSPDQIVYWSLSGPPGGCTGAACGQLTSTGLYTAPQTIPNPPTATITATADADPSAKGTSSVDITAGNPAIAILPNPPAPVPAGSGVLTFDAVITNAPQNTNVTWQLGCISLYDGDPGENCNDNDFDGDGPGCITVSGGFKVCGTRPNQGPGNESLLYNAPEKLFTNAFAPNSCEETNNGSGDGLVPLTATMNASGCPVAGCQATVCITVTPP
jgi:hypothetical protein